MCLCNRKNRGARLDASSHNVKTSTNILLPGSIPSVLGESIGAVMVSPWIYNVTASEKDKSYYKINFEPKKIYSCQTCYKLDGQTKMEN